MTLPSLSIVLPCHNEAPVLPRTCAVLDELVAKWVGTLVSSCEYVLVNNGSTDETLEVMKALTSPVAKILIVDLRRNFGYQGSISAGLHNARNDLVVSIDADLQDDPEKIAEMVEKNQQGYELVLGVRKSRSADSWPKRFFTQLYYKLLKIMGIESVYNHGEFRLMSRALVEEFKQLSESNRYIRGLILQLESKYAMVYYERRAREQGETKFTPSRLISLALDGITSFSSVPIRLVTLSGSLMAFVALGGLAYVVYVLVFTHYGVPGWASLATIMLFFFGIQTLFLGIVGEYIAKTYMETKRRPVFTVRARYEK